MTAKMKEITITTATIDFGDWKISATGQLDEFNDWRIEVSYSNPLVSSRYWNSREWFSDEEDVEKFLWEEVDRINKKYSACVFEYSTEEVEDEDYEEDEE